jgi:capsular exopolysaccharide synthesis family protein
MLQRMTEASISASLKSRSIQLLDPAEVPKTPYRPNFTANMLLALAAGLLLGIASVLLAEAVDAHLHRHLKTAEDVKQAVRLPFLGLIPSEQIQPSRSSRRRLHLRTRGSGIEAATFGAVLQDSRGSKGSGIVKADRVTAAVELVTHFDSKSHLSEAYRDLRTSILLSATADSSPKTLLFTSSVKGEGRTATCINLAVTMAQAYEKVLLIDCDLRNPSIHRIFGLNNTNGVSTFLSGTSTSSLPLIQFSQEYHLFVFPAGRIPPNPAELIESMRMEKCLGALAQHFDHILIDSPPLLSAVDARILATYVDGVILVIKGTTTKETVMRSKRLLRDAHARILGTMLNDVDPPAFEPLDYSKHNGGTAGHPAGDSDPAGGS